MTKYSTHTLESVTKHNFQQVSSVTPTRSGFEVSNKLDGQN